MNGYWAEFASSWPAFPKWKGHVLCAGRMGNVILSSVPWWLSTSKTSTCTRSSSSIIWCLQHRHCCLENGIHSHGNWETIGFTFKRWYLRLRVTRWRYKKWDNIWTIQLLEPLKEASGIWIASPRQWSLYPKFFILSISVSFIISCTGQHDPQISFKDWKIQSALGDDTFISWLFSNQQVILPGDSMEWYRD